MIGRRYWLRHGNRWLHGRIAAIVSRLDIATLAAHEAHELGVNEIGEVIVETQQPLPIARFADDRVAGALLVVDPATNRTSGTLLVRDLLRRPEPPPSSRARRRGRPAAAAGDPSLRSG